MKIKKILSRLLRLHPKSIDLSLHRIQRLLKSLNNPEKKLQNCIQVIGTNGKFSICSTLREIYEAAGYKVNMHISPSVRKFNERYYFSGEQINDSKLHKLLSEVEKVNRGQPITFHEIVTAAFFLEAARTKAHINILEAGLFFRLDASNVLDKNIASIISPIGMDHKDFLKEGTVDEVIFEKCSKLLNGSKIIVSEQTSLEILNKINKTIQLNTSKKIISGKDFKYEKTSNGFDFIDNSGSLSLPKPNMLGDFQYGNISTAIATVKELDQFKVNQSHIVTALSKIKTEGRLQKISTGKLRSYISDNNELILDGGHNALAASVLAKYLDTLNKNKKIYMILGMMANKDHAEFISQFKNKLRLIIAVDIPNQKNFIKKEKLNQIIETIGIKSKTESSIQSSLQFIVKEDANAIIFICGSLYLCGEVLNLN
ncbi:MAG: Mur ligase family protein [Pelagibacteraceae bacterium]|jgi:dihydrofolate synthase/folylpolyglutamate synthase|nr:Mur ligase family protein [Pelagibacteraceae bacterium]|tara:strand:- start:3766 stop:5049 length:1284 start_codon:yes stop_codon:yes gene_type:complete